MKKLFFASALVAGLGMLASCQSDDVVAVNGGASGIAESGLVPVELGINGPSVSVQKRGIGTVGNLADNDSNIWRGENLYLLMVERSVRNAEDNGDVTPWGYSKWSYIADGADAETEVVNFANVMVQTPDQRLVGTDTNALSWLTETTPKYYPNSGTHDFFAYHIDNAIDGGGDPVVKDSVILDGADTTAIAKVVKFKIDGTQDLMNGMATAEDYGSLAEAYPNGGFSAQTARAGVKPNLNMQHLLTRFTFTVQGADATAQDLEVEKIVVLSKTTGRMVVAYDATREAVKLDSLCFYGQTDTLQVKDRPYGNSAMNLEPTVTIDSVAAEGDAEGFEPQKFGEAIMVEPGYETYRMGITLKQVYDVTNPDYAESEANQDPVGSTTLWKNIVIPENAKAAVGSSYAVNVKVYGMAKIEVDATLQGWKDGGDIEVDTNVQ